MLEHAASADVEVCGLVGGRDNAARHYYPVENIADDPATSFYMSPQGQLDAMRLMEEREESLLGIFHSHPDSPALPSPRDLELAAYPGVINFIVSLSEKPEEIGSFRYTGDKFSKITVREIAS